MKKWLTLILQIFGFFVAGCVALCVIVLLGASTYERWAISHAMLADLENARSVAFVEFSPYYMADKEGADLPEYVGQEVVLRRVEINATQLAELRTVIRPVLTFNLGQLSIAECYDPHHRIEWVRPDGSTGRFEICFSCRKFSFEQWSETNLPEDWLAALPAVFSKAGLSPQSSDYVQRASEKMKRQEHLN